MNHKGTKKIETERLILRKFKINDTSSFFENCSSDKKVFYFFSSPADKSLEESETLIKSIIKSYDDLSFYYWAIELKESNEVIGSISVNHPDYKNNACQIAYSIGSKFWNKGFTTEALKKVLDYLFEETDINRIAARHDVKNIASGKVMSKSNMTFEGILRESKFKKNKFCDLAIYSILRREWENNKLK